MLWEFGHKKSVVNIVYPSHLEPLLSDLTLFVFIFTALVLEEGKRYSQTVEQSFHISMAALELPTDAGIYI